MRWSKLKKEIESRFAESLKGRIALYSTRYTSASFVQSRGWITFDGDEIVNFSSADSYNKHGALFNEVSNSEYYSHAKINDDERIAGNVIEKGEFSRFDFHEACWSYLNMNIEEALESDNPIIKSLALLDSRVGKRRLQVINQVGLHPLEKRILQIRLSLENRLNDSLI